MRSRGWRRGGALGVRGAAAVLALGPLGLGGCSGDFDTVVHGRNDFAVDAVAVQAAVDRGGRVLLRGRFDFGEAVGEPYDFVASPHSEWSLRTGPTHLPANGTLESSRNPAFWAEPPRTVFVTRDVEIHGDGTTEIVGGYRTFTLGYRPLPGIELVYDMNTDDGHLGPRAETLDEYPIRPVRVTIASIHFVRSLNASIWLAATKGETRITGNRFSDNKMLIERYWFGSLRGNSIYTQGGVASLDFFTYPDSSVSDMRQVLPRSDGLDSRTGTPVQGDLVVSDNILETERGGLIYAISLGGDISVTDNTVKGGGIGIFGYFGDTVIQANHIESRRPIRNTLRVSEDSFGRHHPLTKPAGRSWAEGDWDRASTLISDNTVVSGGLTALEVLISSNVVLRNNHIVANRLPSVWSDAIYLWQVHGATVRANTITGTAVYGLHLVESTDNVLEGNILDRFTPQALLPSLPAAHLALFFGANDNVADHGSSNGQEMSYLEFGTNGNAISGFGPPVGQLDGDQGDAVAQAMGQLRWSGEE